MTVTHLVIPDAHASFHDELDRFQTLGQEILETKPDTVIIIGDFGDFNSLNSHVKIGSLEMENARVLDDIQATLIAYSLLTSRLVRWNAVQKKNHKTQYWPKFVYVEGNHEYRLRRFEETDARFQGIFDLANKINAIYPCTWVPYGQYVDVDNILYTHIPFKNGLPIQSVINTTGAALEQVDKSIVFGHTHRLEFKQKRRAGSNTIITAVNVGCFHYGTPSYANASVPAWWRGVVKLHLHTALLLEQGAGEFDIETLSLRSLVDKWAVQI